jgi:hypothetical protein
MVAGENHHQDRAGRIIAQLVNLAIHAGKREVRSRRAERKIG